MILLLIITNFIWVLHSRASMEGGTVGAMDMIIIKYKDFYTEF